MSAWASEVAALSPLSWWRFRGAGTSVTDEGSAGNTGTLVNTATVHQAPQHCGEGPTDDYSTEFPIASSPHAYMSASPASIGTPTSFTFVCVVNPFQLPPDGFAFLATHSKEDGGSPGDGWDLDIEGPSVLEITDTGTNWHVGTTSTIPMNTRSFIAFSYADIAGSQRIKMYYNGCLEADETNTGYSIIYDASREFRLGSQVKSSPSRENRAFEGLYDEAILWNSVLTDTQIKTLARAGCFYCGGGWGRRRFGAAGF